MTALRDGVVAGAAGAVLSGLPSTLHALATKRDPLEATRAAGTLLLPGEERTARLVPAAGLAHTAISLGWGVVLAEVLPRRHPVLAGTAAGLVIAGIDFGLVGRRFPRIRALPLLPQLADHAAYGAVVGAVLAQRRARATAPGLG